MTAAYTLAMQWSGPLSAVLIPLAFALGASAPGCAPAGPALGPVWLITLESGTDPEGGSVWPVGALAHAAQYPAGHAVSPDPVEQWSSLWTGYWPRTLEGVDLRRVPSLWRDLRAAGREVRAWLPNLPAEERHALTALGLDSWETRPDEPNTNELVQHWSAAWSLWQRWCGQGTPGFLWLHLDAREAQRLGELVELAGTFEDSLKTAGAGHVWAVELGGPSESSSKIDSPFEPWSRLGDLDERCLSTSAWAWSTNLTAARWSWCTLDLAPTLAGCLGLPEPFTEDEGASLLGPNPGYRVLVGEQRGPTHRRQVAWVGDLKLWRAAQPREPGESPVEWSGDHPRLFDWRRDPGELDDLGPGNADRVLQLENVLRLWEAQRLARRRAAKRLGWLDQAEPGG